MYNVIFFHYLPKYYLLKSQPWIIELKSAPFHCNLRPIFHLKVHIYTISNPIIPLCSNKEAKRIGYNHIFNGIQYSYVRKRG